MGNLGCHGGRYTVVRLFILHLYLCAWFFFFFPSFEQKFGYESLGFCFFLYHACLVESRVWDVFLVGLGLGDWIGCIPLYRMEALLDGM